MQDLCFSLVILNAKFDQNSLQIVENIIVQIRELIGQQFLDRRLSPDAVK